MKISANRECLLEAMSSVWGVVPTRSPKPILQNVKLVVDKLDGATLLATDLFLGVTRRVAGVEVVRPGAAILSGRVLAILKASTDEELSIEVDGDTLRIKGKSSNYKLTTEDPDLYPSVPEFDRADYYAVHPGHLKSAIARTQFAVDPDSTRYALGGLLWEFEGDRMRVVATDGRRIAVHGASAEKVGDVPDLINNRKGSFAPVVPQKSAIFLAKFLDPDGPRVDVAVDQLNSILVRSGETVVYSRLVEGRYPHYQDAIGTDFDHSVTVQTAPFLGGIRQAAITTSEESRGIDFTFGPEGLALRAIAADVGDSAIEIPYHDPACPAEGVELTFDHEYFTDMLKSLPEESTIEINLAGKSPSVVRYNGDYTYAVCPLTRGK